MFNELPTYLKSDKFRLPFLFVVFRFVRVNSVVRVRLYKQYRTKITRKDCVGEITAG